MHAYDCDAEHADTIRVDAHAEHAILWRPIGTQQSFRIFGPIRIVRFFRVAEFIEFIIKFIIEFIRLFWLVRFVRGIRVVRLIGRFALVWFQQRWRLAEFLRLIRRWQQLEFGFSGCSRRFGRRRSVGRRWIASGCDECRRRRGRFGFWQERAGRAGYDRRSDRAQLRRSSKRTAFRWLSRSSWCVRRQRRCFRFRGQRRVWW
jgi:hypothetical protein